MRWITLLVVSIFWTACSNEPSDLTLSFYHWKSIPDKPSGVVAYLDQVDNQHIHYRIFDLVQQGEEIVPVADAALDTVLLQNRTFTACIFITNACFKTNSQVEELARKTWFKIQDKLSKAALLEQCIEIQIDCDWTAGTRSAYFEYLTALKNLLPDSIALTATIRLHQVRYPAETGIPPVERGALMCYNMGDIQDMDEINSIFSLDILKTYLLDNMSYPIPLDIALPAFDWYLVYRDNKLFKIIHEPEDNLTALLQDQSSVILDADQYVAGHYLYRGDYIKFEEVQVEDLQVALEYINRTKLKTGKYLLFYHLNTDLTTKLPNEIIQQLVHP